MSKVKLTVLRPWITARLNVLLGLDDDVVVDFVCNQLEESAVRLWPSHVPGSCASGPAVWSTCGCGAQL